MREALLPAFFALAGLSVGSFLNVVVWRLPRGESLVLPRSHCPRCGTTIAWFDNVPLLSWILLRGRCRACGTRISPRYPLVELLTGVLFLLAWHGWPADPVTAGVVAAALAALLAISLIDWEHKIIPDAISKPGILVAILVAPATGLHPEGWAGALKPALSDWLHAAAGAAVGAAVILAIRWLGALAFRKEAMGLGDVKLLALIGALVGPLGVLYVLVIACVGGATIGLLRLLWARRRPLAFPLVVRPAVGPSVELPGARIEGEDLVFQGPGTPPPGPAKVSMTLPAAGILEDHDALVEVRGEILPAPPGPETGVWRVHVTEARDEDRERLDLFAASLRYVPFGPFLALGGAALLLFGPQVVWFITEGWPRFVRGR